jgi:hypothetical protein
MQQELEPIRQPQKQLLNRLLLEEIDSDTFAETNTELRERAVHLRSELEACDRGRNKIIDIAVKAFELSQDARAQRVMADYAA